MKLNSIVKENFYQVSGSFQLIVEGDINTTTIKDGSLFIRCPTNEVSFFSGSGGGYLECGADGVSVRANIPQEIFSRLLSLRNDSLQC